MTYIRNRNDLFKIIEANVSRVIMDGGIITALIYMIEHPP